MEIVAASEMPRERLRAYVRQAWHGEVMIAHGEAYLPAEQDGFVILVGDRIAGHASYRIDGDRCELTALIVEPRREGLGSRLVDRVAETARQQGCTRLRVTTTNDNLDALRFYQRRGFRMIGLRPRAVDEARAIKPEIPAEGAYGIPMRDELDLVLDLA